MTEAPDTKKTSPWVWVAVGCGGCAVTLAVAGAIGIFALARLGKSIEREIKDPQARAEKAIELLGTSEMPPGYYPGPSFSIPVLMDMAMITDKPMDTQGEMPKDTERAFIYVNLIRGGHKWRDYIEGRSSPEQLLGQSGMRFDGGEVIGKGDLKIGKMDVAWVARRGGSFRVRDSGPLRGLTALMFLRCPQDQRMRVGVWITPDPAEAGAAEADLTGTSADPAAIEGLLSRFALCGA